MAKNIPQEKLFILSFVRVENRVMNEEIIKSGLTHREAETLKAEIIAKNTEDFKTLSAELRQLEEAIDSPEKRGKITAVKNKLNELQYPKAGCTFATVRDRAAEEAAAKKATK